MIERLTNQFCDAIPAIAFVAGIIATALISG
jgi:hypothetical protein